MERSMSITETSSKHRSEETIVGQWQLDPARSSVEFQVSHLWGLATVKGQFDIYEGRLALSADPAIELTIDANSVQTGNHGRDQDLRSAHFFDVENHPQVRFTSDSVVLSGETLKVSGLLSARGQSIPLELDARARRLNGEIEIEAATSAPHRKLGMTWNPLRMIPPHSGLSVKGCLVPARSDVA
jgi:polyisoprenoid-binding protein YceI